MSVHKIRVAHFTDRAESPGALLDDIYDEIARMIGYSILSLARVTERQLPDGDVLRVVSILFEDEPEPADVNIPASPGNSG